LARTLNLGILAHVDAGKTSLTERLLHNAGAIDEIGSVDAGNTQTDSLALERQRGITIKSAVVAFAIDDVTVDLIDTPGHPDFIAEVERVLSVLDGAVLVVSAVEGVQAQTRLLMRALQRLRIPTLLFVNKIDRRGAHDRRTLHAVVDKLTPSAIAMGTVTDRGTRRASFTPYGPADEAFTSELAELLADHDDTLLADYVDGAMRIPYRRLRTELAAKTRQARVHPVYFGSAITGAGVEALTAGIKELLPATDGDAGGPVAGRVFKVERGAAGEKVAYARLFSGTVRTRDRLPIGDDGEGKVTAIEVFEPGSAARRPAVAAGQIGRLWGLAGVRIGDAIGVAAADDRHHFAPPTLETVVVPARSADRRALHTALTQLAEQDPLIGFRQDGEELSVSLYGEVQKEVIEATLATEFGVDVTFRETTTICIERPTGTGAAFEIIGEDPNPYLATVGLRVEAGPLDSGIEFRLEVERGSLPPAFLRAIEEAVPQALRRGLYGWEVADCVVTLTHSGYWARQSHSHATFDKTMSSTAGDFRDLTPIVLMRALEEAGTRVYEPMHRFHLELPADVIGTLLPALARLRAVPETPVIDGASCSLEGEIPAAHVHVLTQQLPALTRGEGLLESAFHRYAPVHGSVPTR
jgi:ribosomal protection tetracycline resistance protein